MIAFTTLFLGLVVGVQTVELTVGEPVSAVELRLDGRQVTTLRGAPWSLEVDLGSALAPHRLVAIAYDAEGRELDRAQQWLNLPRPRSQVELLPESSGGGPPRTVRVIWTSVDGARPDAASFTFDGLPIVTGDLERLELPAYDPARLHLLRAELLFGRSLARSELIIGGRVSETVGAEMTAFPVRLADGHKPPSAAEMTGWFRHRGGPLRVVAVERGAADLIVVQDQAPRVIGQLDRLRRDLTSAPPSSLPARPGPTGINEGDRLRVIVPYGLPVARGGPAAGHPSSREEDTRPDEPGTPRELFPISGDLARPARAPSSVGAGRRLVAGPRLSGILAAAFFQAPPAGVPQRLADAVAEAGRAAVAGARPRLVILITGPRSSDASRFSAGTVRGYLRRLRVPLVVWSPETPAGWSTWGTEPVDIRGRAQLMRAASDVRSQLDRQLVVWLEGRHLPQEIQLDPAARGRLRPLG